MEGITCRRSTVETQDDCRLCRLCLLDTLVTLVEHSLDTSVARSGNQVVAHTERSVAHENSRDITAALVERRLYDATRSLAVWISLQFEHVGLKEHLLEKFVNANALLGTDFLTLVLSAPLLYKEVHIGEVFPDLISIGTRLVNLVDGKYHRHVGSLCVGDCLTCGRHHAVVGSDDDDGDIGDLGTTGTHGGECLMTWSVEECDMSAVLQRHVVCTDMLGDTTCLTGDDVGIADMVEERSLTMVYVSHHGNDRSTWQQIVLIVRLLIDSLRNLGTNVFCLEAELLSNEVDGLCIETLVDRHHDADAHTGTDDLVYRDVHHVGKFADGNELRKLQYLALCLLLGALLLEMFLGGVALLLAVFGSLLVLSLAGEARKRLLYLTCYILLTHFCRLLSAALAVLLLV